MNLKKGVAYRVRFIDHASFSRVRPPDDLDENPLELELPGAVYMGRKGCGKKIVLVFATLRPVQYMESANYDIMEVVASAITDIREVRAGRQS